MVTWVKAKVYPELCVGTAPTSIKAESCPLEWSSGQHQARNSVRTAPPNWFISHQRRPCCGPLSCTLCIYPGLSTKL